MPERPWKDEFTLLCERCGYVIEGLDTAGACPECGKTIAESLPERRVGTAWQNHETWRPLIHAAFGTIARPFRTLDLMKIDERSGRDLAMRHALAASVLCIAPIWLTYLVLPRERYTDLTIATMVISPLFLFLGIGLIGAICNVLTSIEARGLVVFGARRGARLDGAVAWSICGHGSAGWLLAGAGLGWSVTASLWAIVVFTNQHAAGVAFWVGAILTLTGFLFFETFAWLGLRRCRFANRVRSTEASPERE